MVSLVLLFLVYSNSSSLISFISGKSKIKDWALYFFLKIVLKYNTNFYGEKNVLLYILVGKF